LIPAGDWGELMRPPTRDSAADCEYLDRSPSLLEQRPTKPKKPPAGSR